MIKIEKGYEPPTEGFEVAEQIKGMQIGDSFFIEGCNDAQRGMYNRIAKGLGFVMSSAKAHANKDGSGPGGIRFYRIAGRIPRKYEPKAP